MKSVAYCVLGIVFGATLMLLSFCAAGFGHGTYVLVGITSSPLGAFPVESAVGAVAFLGTPILWGFVAWLLSLLPSTKARIALLIFMAVHYATAAILVCGGPFADWSHVPKPKVQSMFVAGIVVYLVGQATIWIAFLFGGGLGARGEENRVTCNRDGSGGN